MRLIVALITAVILFTVSCTPREEKQTDNNSSQDTSAAAKELARLNGLIKADPYNADFLYQRAKLHMERKELIEANEDMQIAVKVDSTKADYYILLADISYTAKRTYDTRAYLEKALSLNPDNSEAALRLAELYFIMRNYEGALTILNAQLEKDKKNVNAMFMKGMIVKEMGDTSRAVKIFQQSVETDPDFYNAYMQLGILYQIKNDPAAEGYFTNAIRIQPKSEEAFYGRGLWYQDHDELDKAIQDYTTIVQLNPNNARAHFNLGYIHHVLLKVMPEAIKHYSRAIDAEPRYVEAWYNRGICYEAVGNLDAAAADFKEALKLRPAYPAAEQGLQRVTSPAP